ncbi:MAG: DUF1365 domain-containing protein [Gemmatimonadales bacterium]
MKSALYEGMVRHRRLSPVPHRFRQRLFMVYLDLEELPRVFAGTRLWSVDRAAPAWFRRADYLGASGRPLDHAVRNLVERRIGHRPSGPIRMLTHLRYWGFVFNPVTFYYCFEPAGEAVEAIVAEVTNTPWNERYAYVLDGRSARDGSGTRHRLTKRFHVSPFMPMSHDYHWRFSTPGRSLVVHMESVAERAKVFDATLALRRRPITGRTLRGALLKYPAMTLAVVAGIYWQAAALWIKGAPFHSHPERRAA